MLSSLLCGVIATVLQGEVVPLCSPAVEDKSPRRSTGGIACCKELFPPRFRFPAWERDYLNELVNAAPDGRCICQGDKDNPVEVRLS